MPSTGKNHEPQKPRNGVNTEGFNARCKSIRKRKKIAKQSRKRNRG